MLYNASSKLRELDIFHIIFFTTSIISNLNLDISVLNSILKSQAYQWAKTSSCRQTIAKYSKLLYGSSGLRQGKTFTRNSQKFKLALLVRYLFASTLGSVLYFYYVKYYFVQSHNSSQVVSIYILSGHACILHDLIEQDFSHQNFKCIDL